MTGLELLGRAAGLLAITCAAWVPCSAQAAPQERYELIDLGTGGGLAASAYGITNDERVFGEALFPTGSTFKEIHLFSWSRREGYADLGTFLDFVQDVTAVSKSGHVVASLYKVTGIDLIRAVAFSAPRRGGLVEIGTLGVNPCTLATDVNNAGVVVGEACVPDTGDLHAFAWSEKDGMRDLGTLGGTTSIANAVNERGQVVGDSTVAGGGSHAFSWTEQGGMIDLGSLGGSVISSAQAVSDAGHVVGWSASSDLPHAFLWTSTTGMTDLGTLGGSYSAATAVNESGAVIGVSTTSAGEFHAFYWSPRSGMVDLGTFGGSYSVAAGINQSGVVIGNSATADGVPHAFVWSEDTGLVDLGPGAANGINARGEIAGALGTHAVVWEPVGGR